ncbi:ATP-dependent Clp protease adaptor ClpS family protein [Mycobacterium xenopi 4042]|uniref:ATP-dependent Clp protease adaptor ClpS family protein n=1 Tax=Mycobacterium xenopi 4042 TaxID=1299334 RepID=X8CM81_MYCXE|nr:ATP-dependent Clp protease adaptor ClpS family protein [Mycobacterium xenopi 4042]
MTIVWDDPVNLMTYVTYVFQKLFGYSEPHATKLMLQVHNEGKAVVSSGSREQMEVDVSKLHAPDCGPPCSRTGDGSETARTRCASGAGRDRGWSRFRSALARMRRPAEELVGSLIDMLDQRESSAPPDELEQITGMRTAIPAARRCDAATAAARLPPAGRRRSPRAESLNAALRSLHEPEIIDAKRVAAQQLLDTVPDDGGRFELTEQAANAWIAAVNDIRLALGTMLGISPDGPERLPDDHPLAPTSTSTSG